MPTLLRAVAVAAGAITVAVGGSLVLNWSLWTAAVAGVALVLLTSVVYYLLRSLGHSQQKFADAHGWTASPFHAWRAIAVLEGRTVDGGATDILAGAWRDRAAVQFQARVHTDGVYQQWWFEAVFDVATYPLIDIRPRWRIGWRREWSDPLALARDFDLAWKVSSADPEFARVMLHRGMQQRLMEPDARGRILQWQGPAVLTMTRQFVPNTRGADVRLNLLSDLVDLVPREALDLVLPEDPLAELEHDEMDDLNREEWAAANDERRAAAPRAGDAVATVTVRPLTRQRTSLVIVAAVAAVALGAAVALIVQAL